MSAGSTGLAGVPNHGLVPSGSTASSCRLALPTRRAPAARAPARHAASRGAGTAVRSSAREPPVVGTPSTSMMSFTATRGPLPELSRRVMNVLIRRPYPRGAVSRDPVRAAGFDVTLAVGGRMGLSGYEDQPTEQL